MSNVVCSRNDFAPKEIESDLLWFKQWFKQCFCSSGIKDLLSWLFIWKMIILKGFHDFVFFLFFISIRNFVWNIFNMQLLRGSALLWFIERYCWGGRVYFCIFSFSLYNLQYIKMYMQSFCVRFEFLFSCVIIRPVSNNKYLCIKVLFLFIRKMFSKRIWMWSCVCLHSDKIIARRMHIRLQLKRPNLNIIHFGYALCDYLLHCTDVQGSGIQILFECSGYKIN